MTDAERITQLEARTAQLEARIARLETPKFNQPYPYPPIDPWIPPYTITCKLADGTTKDMTFTTPIVAQTNETL